MLADLILVEATTVLQQSLPSQMYRVLTCVPLAFGVSSMPKQSANFISKVFQSVKLPTIFVSIRYHFLATLVRH